ncbi:hypothetical protein BGZ68_008337 [Mortierella alpina]|nr:hypothetical protein BGZ68_008337 [Mortierella alpina]
MTPKSAAHTVFTTPELAFAISGYLTQHDLTQCVRVCKDWQQLNEPMLYTTFCPSLPLGPAITPPTTGGVIRNLHHIRTVELCTPDYSVMRHYAVIEDLVHGLPQNAQSGDSGVGLSALCTNIKRLKVRCGYQDNFHSALPHLTTLLNHNRFLTRLTIPLSDSGLDTALLVAVSKLRHLQSLALYADSECQGRRTICLLLQACLPLPELSELDIDLDICDDGAEYEDIPDLDTIIEEATIARFSGNSIACKIKTLRLPRCPQIPLVRSLLESALLDLESFTVPSFSADSDTLRFEQLVREYCTSLKHLTCPYFKDHEDGRFVRAVIRGCSGLKSFTSKFFFADENDDYEPQFIISDLVGQHCDTLEEITFENCMQIFSGDLQAVLTRCKQLRRLWVQSIYPVGRASIEFTDMSMSDWACTELRELGLTLNRYPNGEDSDLDDEDPGLMALDGERFYRQIGKLEKLEELALDIDRSGETMSKESDYAWDLTLAKGWLSELGNLKNLQRLRLNADFWSKMGQTEVEFMHEHWPLLCEISLQGRVSDQRSQAHWQWLFDKRPRLLFTMKER